MSLGTVAALELQARTCCRDAGRDSGTTRHLQVLKHDEKYEFQDQHDYRRGQEPVCMHILLCRAEQVSCYILLLAATISGALMPGSCLFIQGQVALTLSQ